MTREVYDFEIEDVDGEIFKRIYNTDCFINKFGVLYRKDLKTIKDLKKHQSNDGSYRFKICGKTYFLNTVLNELFKGKIRNEDLGLKRLFNEKINNFIII